MESHAVSEGLLTDKALKHRQDATAFAVGDAIKGIENVGIAGDRIADLAGIGEAIIAHDANRSALRGQIKACARIDRIHSLIANPGGEGFVQPNIIPPDRRDEIAEPLMPELMRVGCHDAAFSCETGALIDEQSALSVDNRSGILHGAIGKVWHGDQVEFSIRIGIVEIGFLPGHHFIRDGHGFFKLSAFSGGGEAAEGDCPCADFVRWKDPAIEQIIRTDGQRHEIRLNLTGRRKLILQRAIIEDGLRPQSAIGDNLIACRR